MYLSMSLSLHIGTHMHHSTVLLALVRAVCSHVQLKANHGSYPRAATSDLHLPSLGTTATLL